MTRAFVSILWNFRIFWDYPSAEIMISRRFLSHPGVFPRHQSHRQKFCTQGSCRYMYIYIYVQVITSRVYLFWGLLWAIFFGFHWTCWTSHSTRPGWPCRCWGDGHQFVCARHGERRRFCFGEAGWVNSDVDDVSWRENQYQSHMEDMVSIVSISVKFYDILWISMIFYDILWYYMIFYDILWLSMCILRLTMCILNDSTVDSNHHGIHLACEKRAQGFFILGWRWLDDGSHM